MIKQRIPPITLAGPARRLPRRRTVTAGATLRVRVLAAVLVLALPLAGGIWAFAAYAGRSERRQADAQLGNLLQSAQREYERVLETAATGAATTAARRDVQTALARRRRAQLVSLARTLPGTQFVVPGLAPAGTITQPAALQTVQVVVGRRAVGKVVVATALDDRLLARLSRATDLPAGDRLWLRSGVLTATGVDLDVAGSTYRAAASPLTEGRHAVSLVVLRPASLVSAGADRAQRRVFIAGFVVLGSLIVLAYAFAPAIALGRTLRQQREQAARVLSHLGEGVVLVDDGGTIRLWNRAAELITGLSSVVGRPILDVVPGWAEVHELIPSGSERPQPVTVGVELPDRRLWLSVSAARFSEGTAYAFRDLSEEQRLERMRTDFVTTISHELRTPLASIHGAVMTLARPEVAIDSEVGAGLLRIMREQSERLSQLVDRILLVGQLGWGDVHLANEEFDPAQVVREAVETSSPRVPQGVSLELTAPDRVPTVVGDAEQTTHVLSNLIDNAVKYSPDGGRIEISLEPTATRLRFIVRDEGLGIPADEQERIFEKFYRLDASMTRGVGGSGLGLFICRELVSRMGGEIWVESNLGGGSTFTFELPLRAPRQVST